MKLKTTHEIIDEIAGLYTLETRSMIAEAGYDASSLTCQYNGANGRHCAFAHMVIKPEELQEGINSYDILNYQSIGVLKPEYRGCVIKSKVWMRRVGCGHYDFYRDIQRLHDDHWNWNKEGLSEPGKEQVEKLKEKYPLYPRFYADLEKWMKKQLQDKEN